MLVFKKLVFAPLFLIVFAILLYQLNPLFKSYDLIFSLSFNSFLQLLIISVLICLSSFLFVIFSTLSQDWKLILPVIFLGSLIPLLLLDINLAVILIIGIFIGLVFVSITLENSLKSYFTFQPGNLLGPPIRHLSSLLILLICIGFFLSANKIIAQKGFQIPDSLLDATLKFIPQSQMEQPSQTPQINIPPDQIDLLKKNPQLLKQYGLDPGILDQLTTPKNSKNQTEDFTNNLIKQSVKDTLQGFVKPYLGFISAVLAILLFFSLQFFTSILNFFIYPFLWIVFLLLEKSSFITFTTEVRPVKKIVV